MIDFFKNLFLNSGYYIILSVFFCILCIWVCSRDKKDSFNAKLLLSVIIFSYIFDARYSLLNQKFIFDTKIGLSFFFYALCLMAFLFRDKLLDNHESVAKLIVAELLSVLFIYPVSNLSSSFYLLIASLIFCIFILSYSIEKNEKLFFYGSIFLFLNLILYSIKKNPNIKQNPITVIAILFFLYVIFLVFVFIISILSVKNKKKNNSEDKPCNLFPERQYDLERIENLLKNHNLIGVNAGWGSGKSFLFNMLKEDSKNDYYFICINVLSMKIDKIESFLLSELSILLEKNRIFSHASGKIKGLLNQSFFHSLGETFFGTNSYNEQIGKLRKEISKLEKPVVIAFEDIDRIADKEIIHKVFALADALKTGRIKIIFQYEEKRLLEILKVEKIYLEKYLQHTVELTSISFERMIRFLLKDNKYSNLSEKDFEFLRMPIRVPFDLKKFLGIDYEFTLYEYGFTIRKFELFFEDIEREVQIKSFETLKDYKKKIIVFNFIKHFDFELYERISDDESFIQECTFMYKEKEYAITQLIKMVQDKEITTDDIVTLLKDDTNRKHFIYLILFEYDFNQLVAEESEKRTERDFSHYDEKMVKMLTENPSFFKVRQTNEKNDRLIKNLKGAGKSENTDYENAVNEMNKRVLNLPQEKQEDGYKDLSKIMYYGEFNKADNQTIFKFGISSRLELFRAFLIYENNPSQWIKLVDFFIKPENEISSELIQTLNYCNLDNRNVILHIFERFSELKVKGNLNDTKSYKIFIYTYLKAIMNNGYMRIDRLNWISDDFDKPFNKEFYINEIFSECKQKLNHLKTITSDSSIHNELSIIEKFIEKNEEIINSEKSIEESIPKVKTSSSIKDPISEQSEVYKNQKLSKEALQAILDEKYHKAEITMLEYACYMNNVCGIKFPRFE